MKHIILTRGFSAVVDDKDYESCIAQGKWSALVTKSGKVYAVRGKGVLLHRFILGVRKRFTQVDHKDGNGLNCRRSNMRKATVSQNQMNQGKQSSNTSGFKGVSWDTSHGKWRVRIRVAGKRLCLGSFNLIKDAAKVYAAAAKKYHKEFAKL